MRAPGAVLALLVTSGCGVGSGLVVDSATGNQIQFHMPVVAERYVRTVSGSAVAPAVFCVIPTDSGLYDQAMRALHSQARLRPNEALQNLRVDSDPWCILVFGARRLTVSADVYEVVPAGGTPWPLVTAPPPQAPAPPRRCMDSNSCSRGQHCLYPPQGGMGECVPDSK